MMQEPFYPPLQGDDIADMGRDPRARYFDLQLANEFVAPTPSQLAASRGNGPVNAPTSTGPDQCIPGLQMGDLSGYGLDQQPALQPDPAYIDRAEYGQPGGLTIIAASVSPFAPDPAVLALDEYERPVGLDMPRELRPEPESPDLNQSTLLPEVHMSDRPGELADSALETLHADPTWQALPTDNYNQLFMQQAGDNQTRSRHMGLLDLGLEREER